MDASYRIWFYLFCPALPLACPHVYIHPPRIAVLVENLCLHSWKLINQGPFSKMLVLFQLHTSCPGESSHTFKLHFPCVSYVVSNRYMEMFQEQLAQRSNSLHKESLCPTLAIHCQCSWIAFYVMVLFVTSFLDYRLLKLMEEEQERDVSGDEREWVLGRQHRQYWPTLSSAWRILDPVADHLTLRPSMAYDLSKNLPSAEGNV